MESKDRLEKFVIEHKRDFGPTGNTPDVWSNIRKREEPVRNLNIRLWLGRAASVVIIFSLAYVFFILTYKPGTEGVDESSIDAVLSELREADEYYNAVITERKEELFSLSATSPSIREDVNKDFADLDAILIELRNDLQDNADNAEVIEAMMQQYRLKLEILEDMLEQVKKKYSKNENEQGIAI